MINASNIFVGTAGGVYKIGSFAIGATSSANAISYAVSPRDKTLATFLVGQSDGTVWQTNNNGTTFTELGGSLAAGNAQVAYGPDGTIYAAVGNQGGNGLLEQFSSYMHQGVNWLKNHLSL